MKLKKYISVKMWIEAEDNKTELVIFISAAAEFSRSFYVELRFYLILEKMNLFEKKGKRRKKAALAKNPSTVSQSQLVAHC